MERTSFTGAAAGPLIVPARPVDLAWQGQRVIILYFHRVPESDCKWLAGATMRRIGAILQLPHDVMIGWGRARFADQVRQLLKQQAIAG
jgi:hypothetical protein